MELRLQLSVFVCLIQASLCAVWQHVTVIKGQTLHLTCPLKGPLQDPVEWKNPDGVRDKRYSIIKLSETEFSISVSSVTFTDGGNYACTHFHPLAERKTVQVTVVDRPKMEVAKHDGMFVIKCSAEANNHAPDLSWMLRNGPEFHGQAQITRGYKTHISTEVLHVHSFKRRVTLKCIARHPDLPSKHLVNFVQIGRRPLMPHRRTTTRSPPAQTQGSTEVTTMMTHGKTTQQITTVGVNGHTTETPSARFPSGTATQVNTDDSSTSVPPVSTSTQNHTDNNETSTTGWTSVSMTTQEVISLNSTEGNNTGIRTHQNLYNGHKGNTSLLIFLVTCLIFGLLVVVLFIGIKLRRAHIAWKKENDDSDPSEDSSKSKSSQEERNAQAQRRRGHLNTAFTQYVVEEPTVITSVTNTAAMTTTEVTNTEQPCQPPRPAQTVAQPTVKETEL